MGRMDRRGQGLVDAAKAAGPRARELGRAVSQLDIPWARCAPARALRETIQSFVLAPLIDLYVRRRARGREHFSRLKPPVIMVANHGSHLDTPVILRALPRRWRRRTAVAAAADYFYRNRLVAFAVSLLFNTVPVSRSGGGLVQGAADHIHRLIDQRWNLLLYPEGTAHGAARSAGCARAPPCSPTSTASRSCRCTSPARATPCRPAARGRAGRARCGCAGIRWRCASAVRSTRMRTATSSSPSSRRSSRSSPGPTIPHE